MEHFFSRQIASLMENEPEKVKLLRDEIGVVTYEDLITYFPFRYEDRSKCVLIKDIVSTDLSLSIQGRVKAIKKDRKDKKLTIVFSASQFHDIRDTKRFPSYFHLKLQKVLDG